MKRLILAATFFHLSLAPAFGQICLNGYSNQDLEEDAPVQRTAPSIDKNLVLSWSLPAEFTEILPFSGEPYQLAELNTNESALHMFIMIVRKQVV